MPGFAAWAFTIAITFLVAVPVNGLMIAATWNWFIAPIVAVRHIGIAEAIGMSIFFSVITYKPEKLDLKGETDEWQILFSFVIYSVGAVIVGPIFLLTGGWFWYTFVIAPN